MRSRWIVMFVLSACQMPMAMAPMAPNSKPVVTAPTATTPSAIVAMPDLTLLSRAEAEAALRRAGFTQAPEIDTQSICGSVLDDDRTKIVELGRVCYQHPVPGAETKASLPVLIRVQTEDPRRGELGGGRFWFLMPDLAGVDVATARARIRTLGFTKQVDVDYDDDCKPDVVCRTDPKPMTRTDNVSTKTLYVGRAEEPTEP